MSRRKIKTKRYSVGVNAEQEKALRDLMDYDMMGDVSTYFGYMILEMRRYREQNVKRSPGRPRNIQDEDDERDTVEMYKVPDKHTTSPYSYNDLVAWYQAHPSEGPMPERKYLIIHPNYKGAR